MELIKKKEKKITYHFEIKEYCCTKMKNLYNNFNVLSLNNKGEMWLFAHNDAGYSFKEKIDSCPFCEKKIEVIDG